MSELEGDASEGDSEGVRPRSAKAKLEKNRTRRAVVAVVAATIVIGMMQAMAPNFDHQIANILSITIGITVALYVVYQAHRECLKASHRWRVPGIIAVSLTVFFLLFEPDGFSGEMMPLFRYRFAKQRELKQVESGPPVVSPEQTDAGSDEADFRQFLGPSRNAVIAERQFSVPSSAADVQVLWDQGIGQGWASFAVSGDRAVTLEQRDQDECVTCYRLADGELLWMQSHQAYHYHPLGGAGPRSTPTIVGKKVYAQGTSGRLWCLDLNSGDPIWTADLLQLANWTQAESEKAIAWGRAASPLIVDDLCVVPFGTLVDPENPELGERSLIAFDAETGDVRWKGGHDQISYASPIVMELAGQRQIVSVNEKTISGHGISDGKMLWMFNWPGASNSNANCTMAIPAGADRFLIGKGYGGGSSLVEISKAGENEFTAEPIWESFRVLKTKFTHACIDGDVAYALSDGSLQAVSLADGQRLWMQPRSTRFGQGQILLVDDVIIAQAEAGDIVIVSADSEEYKELFRMPALTSKTWNIPTIAGRHLLVRNDRQAICFLLPE